jgi:hypothetical protein
MKSSRVPTIRSTLALLVIACMIPASLVAAVLITYNYQRERSTLVRDSILTARALTSALDRELAGIESALFALATSPFLSSNDLVAFEEQAKEVLPIVIADNIVLIDANGQQVANTLRSSGEPLPYGTSLELRRIFDTGQPVITNHVINCLYSFSVSAIVLGMYFRCSDDRSFRSLSEWRTSIPWKSSTSMYPARLTVRTFSDGGVGFRLTAVYSSASILWAPSSKSRKKNSPRPVLKNFDSEPFSRMSMLKRACMDFCGVLLISRRAKRPSSMPKLTISRAFSARPCFRSTISATHK